MSIGYVLKEGVAGLNRARLASFTSIFSLFAAMLLLGVITRIGYNAWEVSRLIRQQVEVEVFLEDISDEITRQLQDRIGQKPEIGGFTYISKDSASKIFQEDFGMGNEFLADIDFLPASFRLSIAENISISQIDSLTREIEGYEGVDEVRFNQALLQSLETRMELVTVLGSAIGLFILIVAIILVFNTIRLTIYAKRDLIRAMKLVGATDAFIRRPFLMEGILQGILAGGAASFIVLVIFDWVIPRFLPQIGVLSWPLGEWYYLVPGMLLVAVLMGWIGSRLAARKFIRKATANF